MQNNEIINNIIEPKAIIVAIGGNEDKEQDLYVLRRLVNLTKNRPIKIEIITTASEIPKEIGDRYKKAFSKIDNSIIVKTLDIASREETDNEQYIERTNNADIIFFTGGDQLRITSILGGTKLLNNIVTRCYKEEFILGGTSAGATALSQTMIYNGESKEALVKGSVKVTAGIELLNGVIIDSHFIKRGRFSRLMEIITTNPGHIGIGLGEDTGIIIHKGYLIETIGNGLVVVFDGMEIKHSNIAHINNGNAIAVENMRVHTLVDGYSYDLYKKEYLAPSDIERG